MDEQTDGQRKRQADRFREGWMDGEMKGGMDEER
jgi:hypothetical protein